MISRKTGDLPWLAQDKKTALTQRIGLGEGLKLLNEALYAGPVCVIVDQNLYPRLTDVLSPQVSVVSIDGQTTPETVHDLADQVRGVINRDGCLISIGGGMVIDRAKLALGLIRHDTEYETWLAARAVTNGVIIISAPSQHPGHLVAIPTTVGTGSENNTGACLTTSLPDQNQFVKTIVLQQGARPEVSVYDPFFNAGPPDLILWGVWEILFRLAGAYVSSPSLLPIADRWAISHLYRCVDFLTALGESAPDDTLRLRIALLSAATHTGPDLQARGLTPSLLWILATELSMALSVTKNEASLRLFWPWLRRVLEGDTRWGDHGRALHVLQILGIAPSSTDGLLTSSHTVPIPPLTKRLSADSAIVAHSVKDRFSRWSPALRQLSVNDIGSVINEGITPCN